MWTREELAAIFNLSPPTIAQWQRKGLGYIPGRPVRYSGDDLVDFIYDHLNREDARKHLRALVKITYQAATLNAVGIENDSLERSPHLSIAYDPEKPSDALRAMSAEREWQHALKLEQDREIEARKYIRRDVAEQLVTAILQAALDHYLPASPSDEDKAKWDALAVKIESLVAEVTGGVRP